MNIRSYRAFVVILGLAIAFTAFAMPASGQFTINIPNLPKIKKPTPTPTPESTDTANSNNSSNTSASSGEDPKPKAGGCESDTFYQVWNEEIQKTVEDVKSFSPGRDYFVRDFNDDENKYLKMALSTSERADYEKGWSEDATKRCVNDRLDELAVLAAKAIGGYKPTSYTLGTLAEKNILKSGVTDLNQAAVLGVGLKSPNWIIVKDDYGLPQHRKRFGMVWAKYPGDKYCKIIYVNLFQDYSGGGTYNASEAQFISWEYAGCPAGK
jgi:hypothetical protein